MLYRPHLERRRSRSWSPIPLQRIFSGPRPLTDEITETPGYLSLTRNKRRPGVCNLKAKPTQDFRPQQTSQANKAGLLAYLLGALIDRSSPGKDAGQLSIFVTASSTARLYSRSTIAECPGFFIPGKQAVPPYIPQDAHAPPEAARSCSQ